MTINNGDTPDADDVLASIGNTTGQLSFEQVKSDSTNWTNTDYLGADIFTAAAGAKSTVDTAASTCLYDPFNDIYFPPHTDEASGDTTHDPDSFTNPENAFDGNNSTFANLVGNVGTVRLGKTFSAKVISSAFIQYTATYINSAARSILLETFDGSIWTTHTTLETQTGTSYGFTGNVLVDLSIQGIRISFDGASGNVSDDKLLNTLEYGDSDASGTVETNTIINEIVPDSIVVYDKSTLLANTSITVDVSDDGGSTFSLTGNSLNIGIDTTSFSTGDIALRFNLATTNEDFTPQLSGYGVAITDT